MKKVLCKVLIIMLLIIAIGVTLMGCARSSPEEADYPFTPGQIAAIVVNALIIPVLAWGVQRVTAILDKKTHNEELKRYFNEAIQAIYMAVKEIMQIYVDALKKDGTWSEETQKEAFKRARARAIQIMGAAALKALPEIVGDVEAWIDSMIEAATQDVKNEKALALAAAGAPEGAIPSE